MDPDEIEFLGESQLTEIIPSFNNGVIHLISGDIGPFRASLPIKVPLWMAINLKQQQKCKIQAPDWMDIEVLENIREAEKTSPNFTPVPSEHYMIEAKLLLGCAPDDISKSEEIRTIVKDIWDIRMSKLRKSVNTMITEGNLYAALDHLTQMEINTVRPILPYALDQLQRMKAADKKSTSQSQNTMSFLGTSSLGTTPFRS